MGCAIMVSALRVAPSPLDSSSSQFILFGWGKTVQAKYQRRIFHSKKLKYRSQKKNTFPQIILEQIIVGKSWENLTILRLTASFLPSSVQSNRGVDWRTELKFEFSMKKFNLCEYLQSFFHNLWSYDDGQTWLSKKLRDWLSWQSGLTLDPHMP